MADATIDIILRGFEDYMKEFRSITLNARQHFEQTNWQGIQEESKQRITLYKRKVYNLLRKVKRSMGEDISSKEAWQKLRIQYAEAISLRNDYEIAETFFNSICRKIFGNIGADPSIMFVASSPDPLIYESEAPIFHTYTLAHPVSKTVSQILTSLGFEYEDKERDINLISQALSTELKLKEGEEVDLQVLKSMFFRNRGAYLIGRISKGEKIIPFVIPFLNEDQGVYADTLLMNENDLSVIFSFARSYFLVDIAIPSEMVRFLKALMPQKHTGDIYNSLGFNKHGKTVFYQDFAQHMLETDDKFDLAPGIPGLVMAVFALPSYPVVFKLIKDKIDPPKKTSRGEVRMKYRMVKTHDRVGRLADTHEFEHLVLPKDRFSKRLLSHLLEVAPSIVRVEGSKLIIDHVYTERKMTPLNIFLDEANPEQLEEVVSEYGNAIKEMAAANIFPGDMFLKNFGVTRHLRVVFYDYDEIGLITDFNFREMPKAQGYEELYAQSPWFGIAENDVFPEEFEHFLVGKENMKELFCKLHSDLFEVEFWHSMQERQKNREVVEVFPYRRRKRFRNN